MSDFQYKRAPITEAVVEIRFASPIDENRLKKTFKYFSDLYSDYKTIPHHEIDIDVRQAEEPVARITNIIHTNQFTSADMTQRLHITPNSFLVSQIAPYEGWGKFCDRIIRDWEILRKGVGFQNIKRVGMRYINRIDMPIDGPILRYEDYITVYPTLPECLDPCVSHAVNVQVNLEDINSVLNLKTAMVESPLPEHLAMVVDLDISQIFESPLSDDELYSYLNEARNKKNTVFESCITDKARELFNQ